MKGEQKRQRHFTDSWLESRVSDQGFLMKVDSVMDWPVFDALLSELYPPHGRPGHPPLLLFKMTLLQQWFGLSDPGVEAACRDRISFHRFLGLSLGDAIPDETTRVRFRQRLNGRDGMMDTLFQELDKQLADRGMLIKRGTLIDASILPAARRPPAKKGRDTADPEARWTTKNGKATHGYKLHVAVDRGSDMVRALAVTPANVHDSQVCDELIQGDEAMVLADKAYHSQARAASLESRGILNGILRRGKRNRPLDELDQQINAVLSKLRAAVERVFADWKTHRNLRRVRYVGLKKNRTHLMFMAMAHNMRCMVRVAG